MSHKNECRAVFLLFFCAVAPFARADLYQAAAAVEQKDFPRAFELYRELAELGHAEAQENLAIFYVNGEGVPRDNVLGYAWAMLALDGGASGSSREIVEKLEPHLTDASRARVSALHAVFGRDALKARLLPVDSLPVGEEEWRRTSCRMRSAADPDYFYPAEAKRRAISGEVIVEVRVWPDGTARRATTTDSIPELLFDAAARAVAFNSRYTAPVDDKGVAKACTLRFRVNFGIRGGAVAGNFTDSVIAETRVKAARGDPRSQLLFGVMIATHPDLRAGGDRELNWFLKSAQAGVPAAQYMVGQRILSGYGVQTDEAKGTAWLERAANGGSADAKFALANYWLQSRHDQATREKGFDSAKAAAESGSYEAIFLYSSLLASWPDPARRDPARALKLIDEVDNLFAYDPACNEIRAAALAGLGKFEEAGKEQTRAVLQARRLDWDAKAQKARLEAYRQKQMPAGEIIEF